MAGGPTLLTESALLAGGAASVGGMDEVGRGALAGPVCVGLVVVEAATPEPPVGLADSKLLTPAQRQRLAPLLAVWGRSRATGWASAREVDQRGVVAALRLAGERALAELDEPPEAIILDGKHNWLAPPADLFSPSVEVACKVRVKVKADRHCACVAAASVIAKVARDQRMDVLAESYPVYHWQSNKGYGTPAHIEALRRFGPSAEHRQSWSLPSPGSPA
ncbi:MAG: ribonuclease HII [Bifidobacteriaceae bacterium]|jgi:ribonuclease HII|nr:ribonuclease HII [Bifidobacteriaceae bacterium]